MINKLLVAERLDMIGEWLNELEQLSKLSYEQFIADSRNPAAAESFIRRSLEAVFDIGRHILAKTGAVDMAGEYKSIAKGLKEKEIVSSSLGDKLVLMAGYRNRMVHFYSTVTEKELFDILYENLADIHEFKYEIKSYILKT